MCFLVFSAFAGVRVSDVGRVHGRRDIDAQSTELPILRKVGIFHGTHDRETNDGYREIFYINGDKFIRVSPGRRVSRAYVQGSCSGWWEGES